MKHSPFRVYPVFFLIFLFNSITFSQEEWYVYNSLNSELPHGTITALDIDSAGNKWIGTWGSLIEFDGINWTFYDSLNSGLPNNNVTLIVIDKRGYPLRSGDYYLLCFPCFRPRTCLIIDLYGAGCV